MGRIERAAFQFKPFSVKQKKVLTWWMPESPRRDRDGIIADGAIRSGKTTVMALSFVIWGMETFEGENFAMCGKTIGSFRRNVLAPLKKMLKSRGYKFTDHRADNLLEVRRGTSVNYFYIFGGKDERSQDLIQGITLAGILFDEVALMPESFVNQAIGRCSVDGSKFWFNCNPEGPKHYFKVEWIDKAEEKRLLYLHFTMEDNLSLSEKIKARYRSMFSGIFFDRFIKGLWKAAEGIIYTEFVEDPDKFIIDSLLVNELEVGPIQYAIIGVDFGGSTSRHSFTLTGFTRGMKQVVVLDEWCHDNTISGKLSPSKLEAKFVDFVKKSKMSYRVYEAYCDSAEQTLIEGFRIAAIKNGLGVEIKNALKGPINERIAFYCSLMSQGRFKIMRHCTATIDALSEAVWDSKKVTDDVRLDDGILNIDSLDSMEYSTESVQGEIMYLSLRR